MLVSLTLVGLYKQLLQNPANLERIWEDTHRKVESHNSDVNALCTLRPKRQVDLEINSLIARIAQGAPVGMLCGAPYAAKDIHATRGLRTTKGSEIYKDWIPESNDPIVQRYLDADAILVGKSNTPEFAAGSQTFNKIFGATRNPFDLSKTVGGSSGGAAAALATGMTLVADGSDLAASLRNPASFCGVVGLRASSRFDPAINGSHNLFDSLSIVGPLGLSVNDVAISSQAIFGTELQRQHRPLTQWLEQAQAHEIRMSERRQKRLRLAYTVDANGQFPVELAVRTQIERAIDALKEQGHELIASTPDFSGADACFQTLRGLYFVECFGDLYRTHKTALKDTVVWNIEHGLKLSASDIANAHIVRSRIFNTLSKFNAQFDAWLLPTTQVLPFSIDVPYPTSINAQPLQTYIDWLKSCYWITVSGHPAISIPAGMAQSPDAKALPVGLQLVGRWMQDADLLEVAQIVETELKNNRLIR
jgi:amidase